LGDPFPLPAAAVVTGAFALGGVALGTTLNWLTARGVEHRAAAGRWDETLAALVDACVRLQVEARTWRMLDTPKSKLRQLGWA
jgi:hypothetical protein